MSHRLWPSRSRSAPAFSLRKAGALGAQLFDVLVYWHERSRERHALSSLSDTALRDIGLSRADVERESRKAFWQR